MLAHATPCRTPATSLYRIRAFLPKKRTSQLRAHKIAASMENAPTSCGRKEKLDGMVAQLASAFQEVRHVTATELHAWLEDPERKVVVVDVRLPAEVEVSVIPGNTLTAEEFEQRKEGLRDHDVVCYCTVGFRSSQAVRRLCAEGFQAYNLEGSIVAWTQQGYPLVTRPPPAAPGQDQLPPQPTKRVHVYGKQWELQGEGYEAVTFRRPFLEMAKSAVRGVLPRWLGDS